MSSSERFWNNIAESYAARAMADPEAYERKLQATRARLGPEQQLLDIGCGTASLALDLAPHVAGVTALDTSREMVRIGQRKVQQAGVTNIEIKQTTVHAAGLADGSFDTICAFNILHLVPDYRATLHTIFALLKPGGSFVSSTSCLRDGNMPYGLVLPVMRLFGKAPAVEMMTYAQLEAAMQNAGFVDIERQRVSNSKTTAFVLANKSP